MVKKKQTCKNKLLVSRFGIKKIQASVDSDSTRTFSLGLGFDSSHSFKGLGSLSENKDLWNQNESSPFNY